ncbi:MAG: ABC transporter substrate-binding protein, partial [Gammaproteobacteria bacterium]
FRFYRSPRGWRIFDVSANGASAVTFYRQYFSRQVRRFGLQALGR